MKKLFGGYDLSRQSWAMILFLTLAILTNRGYGQNSTAIYFAQFAHGGTSTPYQTTFQLFNSSNQDLSVSIKIFQDDGTPFNVGLKDEIAGSILFPDSLGVFAVTIPTRGIKVFSSNGAQSLQTGWVQLTSPNNQLNANVFFQQTDASGNILAQTAVPGIQPSSSFSGLLEKSATVNTGVAFANPSSTATALATLTITNPDGSIRAFQTVSVAPLHHVSKFITDFFPQFTGWGVLSISSNNNLVGLFLRQDQSQLTTLPLFRAVLLPPSLSSVSPPDGAAYATVTITGTNFDSSNPANNQVILGGHAASVIIATSTTLVVTVPRGLSAGSSLFVVTTSGGSSNLLPFTVDAGASTPVITSLNPDTAQAGSGTIQVIITGRNFGLPQDGASMAFGTATPVFQVTDSTSAVMTLTETLLAQAGTFPVVFSNPTLTPFGTGRVPSNPVNFTITRNLVISPPSITGLSPTSGRRGQVVTITGTNFDSTNDSNNVVRFGNAVAPFFAPVLPNILAVIVPPGVSDGALTVTVTTNGLISNGMSFTVLPTPALKLINVGTSPVGVVFDPQTNQALVTNFSDATVTFINVDTGDTTTHVTGGGPYGIDLYRPAVVSDLTPPLAVIANHASAFSSSRSLTFLNLDTGGLIGISEFNTRLTASPFSVAVDSDSGIVLVSNFQAEVAVVDLRLRIITKTYLAPGGYWVGVYHPSDSVDIFGVTNYNSGFLTVYDLQTDALLANIPTGAHPAGFAVDPHTGIAVVANSGDDTISIIDMNSLTNVGTVGVGVRPFQVAIDSVRKRAVVSNSGDGTISVVDLTTKTVIKTLSTGGVLPEGVALSLNANLAIVANADSGTVALIALP
jgi:YVTN family beta-propeller protein